MEHTDKLKKYLAYDGKVAITVAETTEIVEEARKIHDLTPTTTAALGRLLTAVTLMGVDLKNENDSITAQIKGDGPIGTMIAVSDKNPNVRAYIQNPHIELPLNPNGKIDVGGAVGKSGYLNVIKDIGLKEPYVGNVPLQTGEIAEDFAYYYAMSEQTASAVALGVLVEKDGSVKKAGGYVLQIMPDTPDEIISLIEQRLKESKSITQMLEEGMTLEEIAKYISDDLATYEVEELHPKYKCDCSRERMEKALISIGKKDIMELAEDEETELTCQFCNKKYKFSKEEILNLIK